MLRLQDLSDGTIIQLFYRTKMYDNYYMKPYCKTYIISFNDDCIFFSNVNGCNEGNFSFMMNNKEKMYHYNPSDINNIQNFGFDEKYIIVYGIYVLDNTKTKEKEKYSYKRSKLKIYKPKCIYSKDITKEWENDCEIYSRKKNY